MNTEHQTVTHIARKPTWLAGHGGDTRAAHLANVRRIKIYLRRLRDTGRGLPANTLRPKKLAMQLVSDESGVKFISLTRSNSRCREIVEAAANAPDEKRRIPILVRMKDRKRTIYTVDEMINIAAAVFQEECEASKLDHREKCRKVEALLRRVARTCENGLEHDCGEAIQSTAGRLEYSDDDRILLSEIDSIRLRATRGELELQFFHGRLKLEAALRGFGVGALANFTDAATQTVINWGSGLKSPTKKFYGDVTKIEEALGLRHDYLSEVRVEHRSGPSNVKQHHLPKEVRAMSPSLQKEFRRLVDPTINLCALSDEAVEELMQTTLKILYESRDTDDIKRAKLRSEDMQYALPELPPQIQDEFDELTRQRQHVLLMGIVENRNRGWDSNTVGIYHQRFRLLFGWMHNLIGVPLENLSIAYLAFPQVLNEYMLHLVERKEDVGLKKGFSAIAREWYIFAASLTRGPLGGYDADDEDDEDSDAAEPVGWLRSKRRLLDRLAPISIPRRRDELDVERGVRDKVRPILTAKSIAKASSSWADRLDKTARKYRSWRKEHEGNDTSSDSTARVSTILALKTPLEAIEFGAIRLKEYIDSLPSSRARWATAVRSAVTLKFHAQLPLRRATFCALTYSADNSGMVRWENGHWWVVIPEKVFKNEGTKAFEKFVVDGYFRQKLLDQWGLYEDLATYVQYARSKVLAVVDSPAFYVARGNKGHVSPNTFGGEFRLLTRDYIAENRGTGAGWAGVREFGSHAMRHIVATSVWKETRSLHAAAMAIHDSEKITEKHYRKIVEGAEEHLATMSAIMSGGSNNFVWPKYAEVLPRLPSPPSAPAGSEGVLVAPRLSTGDDQ
ncbi:hypothetical protein LRP30_40710 [Bradyrhizobium sp. C-145]|uniref:hypothetical protein n=1 Tax=Bradyrhizobium sp. C-145 TaxID=574727 RepID=UPI00201B5A38|nr:hypothetical protein [Bradyrhizobium sp. C-145]UQR62991.1 hypothetical protein LRP30_40710 [Bradyrhizobium sp. C-145]